MGVNTVIPRVVIGYAEAIAHEVEADYALDWREEDAVQMTADCREVRERFDSLCHQLRDELGRGVLTSSFVAAFEPTLQRLEKLVEQCDQVAVDLNKLEGGSPAFRSCIEEFGAMGGAARRYLSFLKSALSTMASGQWQVDWKTVEEAQAAHARGESRPFKVSGMGGK
jgi:hypothetical protein